MNRTPLVLSLLSLVLLVPHASAQATQPTPASAAAESRDALAASVSSAYQKLQSLEQAGTLSVTIDAAGQKSTTEHALSARFAAPAKFVHEVKDQLTVASTGEKTFIYLPPARQYVELAALSEKTTPERMPEGVVEALRDQNPSLLLAIAADPIAALQPIDGSLQAIPAIDLGGVAHPTLQLAREDGLVFRLLIDPQTKLLRQARIDASETLRKAGVPSVAKASIVIDYASTSANPTLADDAFAWAPPKSARQIGAAGGEELMSGAGHPLEGKPAPAFTLASLEGNDVSMADLKGKVVVLDFWATWCPPCREGLPHLAKLAGDHANQPFQLYAVNVREDAAKVKAFLEQSRLELPVLMDAKGAVAQQYGVSGIPQTVIVGKDGTVRKVFVGFGPGSGAQIDAAVKAALAAP
jgi:peroxiredoxin/outer membrane lipoprotein-sorting protein